jgi:hypothetical protein
MLPRNRDLEREKSERRVDLKTGAVLPIPYRCCLCPEDACYYDAGIWKCTSHWLESLGKPWATSTRQPSTMDGSGGG